MPFAEEEDTEDGEGVVRPSKEIWSQAEWNQVSQVMRERDKCNFGWIQSWMDSILDGFNFGWMLADFEMYKIFPGIAEKPRRRLLFQWIRFLTNGNTAGELKPF